MSARSPTEKSDDAAFLAQTLEAVRLDLAALGLDSSDIASAPKRTLGKSSLAATQAETVLRGLGRGLEEGAERIELGPTIGEGGMGLVREGTQIALGREVAVKSLRPQYRSPDAEQALLREAWVTGSLEHPNVVPVYDIATGARGEALIVLKRIEGKSWLELLEDEAAVKRLAGERDPLDWHLTILLRVADALRFAHSRGIVHRDLKPENVMIGEFGEVYLVDWGIAIRFRNEDGSPADTREEGGRLAGTPVYMAPEMLGGRAAEIGPATDVYLLGSVLYEIVTGHPPHLGENLQQIIASIALSRPEIPEWVPEELAAILRRAMAPRVEDRFPTVEELATALRRHRAHRGSDRIAALAAERLEALEALLRELPAGGEPVARGEKPKDEGTAELLRERQASASRLYSECRFGFQQALDAWPENERARRGLRRAVELMAGFELAHGDPRAASRVLREIEDPPEDIARRVEEAIAKADLSRRELERLRAEQDLKGGRFLRVGVATTMGAVWSLFPLLATRVDLGLATDRDHHLLGIGLFAGFALLFVMVMWLGREVIARTVINRRVALGIPLIFLVQLVVHGAAYITDQPFEEALIQHFLFGVTMCAAVAVAAEAYIVFGSLLYLIGGVLALAEPRWLPELLSLCNLGMVANYVLVWLFRKEKKDRSLGAAVWNVSEIETDE